MRFFNIFIPLLVILFASACSSGSDGDIFLRVRAVLEPSSFNINCSDFPENFEYDVFYNIPPGYYSFDYVDYNGTQHPQLGELSVLEVFSNSGSKGGLFKPGENGEDVYVDLILLSSGPIIETNSYFTIASTISE